MTKKTFADRLSLIQESKKKIDRMQNGHVFVVDFDALRILRDVTLELQECMLQNVSLKKKLKFCRAYIKKTYKVNLD